MERPGFEADRFRLVVRDATEREVRFTTRDWDRSIDGFRFSADGREIYAVADDLGQHPLFAIDLGSGERRKLTTAGNVTDFDIAGERIVFGMQSLSAPADLYLVDGRAPALQVTHVNAARLADVRFGEYEPFSFAGAGGDTVYGYVMKPWNFTAGQRYPVAFIVHGGPQSSFANTWSYRWNPQVYAGAGYGVVFVDFHGSTGYGQAFTDSISQDWGGGPLEDLQKGLAAAAGAIPLARRRPRLRARRLLWRLHDQLDRGPVAGSLPLPREPRRHLRQPLDVLHDRGTWFPEWDHGGPYFENPEGHERSNPAQFVTAWKTPMLVIHGGLDFRVPYAQGLATFTALQRRGIESRFLFFPDENHWILKPANSLQWHAEVIGWLDRHLK